MKYLDLMSKIKISEMNPRRKNWKIIRKQLIKKFPLGWRDGRAVCGIENCNFLKFAEVA